MNNMNLKAEKLISILLALALIVGTAGCAQSAGNTENAQAAGTEQEAQAAGTQSTSEKGTEAQDTQAEATTGAQAQAAASSEQIVPTELEIPYTFATKEEGEELLMSNTEYFDGMTQNDWEFRVGKKGATREEYEALARDNIQEFSEEEKAVIVKYMDHLEKLMEEKGVHLPELEEITFIKTRTEMEAYAEGYTHATQIYIADFMPQVMLLGDDVEYSMLEIFAHELFHCMTRSNPDFRKEIYRIIHFTVQDEDFELPPSVKEYYISNPDVEHHNSYATFTIGGEPVDCFLAFVTTKHFENEGDMFTDSGVTALVPTDGRDMYYTIDDASDFYDILGKNTGYVIDPEECMAVNFVYAVLYGSNDPEHPFENPEILDSIIEVLRNETWKE